MPDGASRVGRTWRQMPGWLWPLSVSFECDRSCLLIAGTLGGAWGRFGTSTVGAYSVLLSQPAESTGLGGASC